MGEVRVWNHGSVLVERGRVIPGDPPDVPAHVHADYQISVELTGPVVYRFGRRWCRVERGDLIVIAPWVAHSMTDPGPRQPGGDYRLAFAPAAALRAAGAPEQAMADLTRVGFRVVRDPVSVDRFTAFHRSVEMGLTGLRADELLAQSVLPVLSGPVPSARASWSPGQDAVRARGLERAREALEAKLDESMSLEDLAAISGLSPTALCRGFARRFGVPPHRYVLNLRIDRARRLLREGVPIVRVAQQLGFADQPHFTRVFKRLVQVTPGDYARGRRRNLQDAALNGW